jgi:glycosyltransferase involved in cell wall biosynthesis
MEAVRNPLFMARAFARALQKDPPLRDTLRLMMVGAGSLLEEVRRLLTESGVADCAWLPGARNDVAALMSAADLFALTSLNEGISNTILEAMASALPVIATQVGGNLELVDAGHAGAFVPVNDVEALADTLRRYALDSHLRRSHSVAARARAVEQYGLPVMIEKYLELYDELLRSKLSQRAAA